MRVFVHSSFMVCSIPSTVLWTTAQLVFSMLRYCLPTQTFLLLFCHSPVFLSTNADGEIVQGFAGLDGLADGDIKLGEGGAAHPRGKPLLFVGNHQLFAQDMNVMVRGLKVDWVPAQAKELTFLVSCSIPFS